MGRRNYLIEGLSGTGKTTVCDELLRRGRHAVHGDRELAYRGDLLTGRPAERGEHLWDVDRVQALVADRSTEATFFCGGSRNFARFVDLFDGVFVLEVDLDTLHRRLDARPDAEWGGGRPTDRSLIVRWHRTREGLPGNGVVIDATAPIEDVVDDILRRCAGEGAEVQGENPQATDRLFPDHTQPDRTSPDHQDQEADAQRQAEHAAPLGEGPGGDAVEPQAVGVPGSVGDEPDGDHGGAGRR